MIYKKTIPWIREWKVLIHSKSSCWQTLILWTFCTWTKAPTFLNYMVWAGACFQDLPNHTTAIYFPNRSCQNSLISVLCSIFKDILWMYDTVKQHSTPCFVSLSPSLSLSPLTLAYGNHPNTYLFKLSWTRSKVERQKIKS